MSREAHVRFWESAGVQFPRATHLAAGQDLRQLLPQPFYSKTPTRLDLKPLLFHFAVNLPTYFSVSNRVATRLPATSGRPGTPG